METDEQETIPARPSSIGRLLVQTGAATSALCNVWLAENDLSLPQWVVLSALWREDGLSLTALAKYSGAQMSAASRLVERMEGAKLVERRPDPNSRRSIRVFLTQKGRNLSSLSQFHVHVNETVMDGFSEDERTAFFTLLERAANNIRGASTQS